MKFIPWLIRNAWFPMIIFLSMLIITLTWEEGLDKVISLWCVSILITVLITASYINWKNFTKNNKL